MAAKSYRPVQSNYKLMDIFEYILQQTEPVTATQISKGVDVDHSCVMTHLVTLVERKWLAQKGDLYEPGLRIMGMYSAFKMGLVGQRDEIDRKLAILEA